MTYASDIRLGLGGPRIGEIHLDPTAVRGEGGWLDPRLVVPLEITLQPQPDNHQVAVTQLIASLHLREPTFPGNRIGAETRLDLLRDFPCRSVPSGPSDFRPELRFNLTQEQVKLLEDARHAAADNHFSIYIHAEGLVVWLRHTGNSQSLFHPEKSTLGEDGWGTTVGMFSELLPFWSSSIGDMRIDIELSVWVEKVLPGLGYDRVRLVEIDLSRIPEEGILPAQFDKARRKYDSGDYEGCVQECRGIQNAWEKALATPRGQHIAKRLADLLHWPTDDWHYKMVDAVWKGYADMVNAPHHPEHVPPNLPITAADARLCLLLTVILSEYVQYLRKELSPHV